VKNEPGIKTEPGLDQTPLQQFSNPEVRDRVINNLQTQYGSRADATINKLQESIGSAPNRVPYSAPPRPAGQAVPQQPRPMPSGNVAQQQYQQQLAAGNMQRVPQPVQNGQKPAASQFDGAGEEGVLVRQDAAGQTTELGRVEIDRLLHAQLEARAKAMEGGGLMVPLRRVNKTHGVSYHRAQAATGSGRFDGGDDDVKSEEDEDAINSDLDDTDDNLEDDDDDDDGGQIMLCMYDKVQRVKNKWYVAPFLHYHIIALDY
jgi:transcription initiation factor TFIIA large subunit